MSRRRKLTRIEIFGVICIAVIAMLYGYLKLIYDPTSEQLAQIRTQYAELTQEVAAYESTPALSLLKSKVADIEREQAVLSARLEANILKGKMQTQREITKALADINRLTVIHSISVVEIVGTLPNGNSAQNGKNKKDISGEVEESLNTALSGFSWHRYDMTLKGNYSNLNDFVRALENLDAYVYIQDVLLEYEEIKGIYNMRITLLI